MGWANSLFIRILPQLVEIIFLYALYISSSSLAQKQNVLSFVTLQKKLIKYTKAVIGNLNLIGQNQD